MHMFTKIGVTAASAAMPALLWAGAAGAQDSQSSLEERCQSQSQSQVQSPECTVPPTVATSLPQTSGSGSLARTGAEDMLPLAVGGAALAGAVVVRRGLRRRSAA
ncbi:MAG: hypothetical protein WKF86_07900 [Acidimicrobiales bacterium]